MIAYQRFRQNNRVSPTDIGRHPRGVKLGDRFGYRAELAVCGIHRKLVGGIDYESVLSCVGR